MKYKTDQEGFWAGEFGEDYIDRNKGENLLASNLNFFSNALEKTHGIKSCVEFGANIGMNLKALKLLYPNLNVSGIEINTKAYKALSKITGVENAFNESIFNIEMPKKFDLTLIKGVLIHINPDMLHNVYEKLYEMSSNYILIAEYYNPSPVTISYRGHDNKLFKRDFAGEFLDKYPDTSLIDYRFVYRRDPNFPQDDITWFLIKK
jgi:pseudaminic acid biosynthesis-associated methylase